MVAMSRSRRLFAALLTCSATLALASCAADKRTARAPDPSTPTLSLLSYNVNYGLAGDRLTVEAIRRADADVAFLQETNEAWERALREELAEEYPHMAFRHCCGAGGLAVLSRHRFRAEDPIAPPEGGWFPAWPVVVETRVGPVRVLNVHLRPAVSESGSVVSGYFSTPPVRRAEIERYFAHLDRSLPTVVLGDFNEGSGGDAVVFLEQRGLHSALPAFEGEQDTWRWTTSVGTVHAQLDHIVHDDRLEPLEVRVIQDGRSDHLPVWGLFRAAPDR